MNCQDNNFPAIKFISTQIVQNGETKTECILPVPELDDWASANQYCAQFNNGEGKLISIHSFEELEYLVGALQHYGHQPGQTRKIWIGLNAKSYTDQFKWADGSITDTVYAVISYIVISYSTDYRTVTKNVKKVSRGIPGLVVFLAV